MTTTDGVRHRGGIGPLGRRPGLFSGVLPGPGLLRGPARAAAGSVRVVGLRC